MAVAGRSSGRSQDIAFGNIASSLQNAAFQFGAMAGAAQQLYSTLNVFRELEKQLTLTNAIAGGNVETFKQLENAVRNFALGVTFTAAESANALLQLTQAGLNTQQAISAMSGVLTLAAATLEDVNETADLVASTLTSFSLEAGEAARISNLFAASMNQSQASLPKLSFALRQVGPVAAALGVSLEQTTGSLSALFNVGLRGEQAGTALRNVMINLVSPAGEAAKVIKTLGLNIYEADGRMRDFYDILRDLSRRNLADADLAALFGREALAGGIALLQSAATGELDRMTKDMTGTQEAVRVALEQMQSFDAQLKQSRNAIDEFRAELGENLANNIKPLLGFITDLGISFRELDEPTKQYIITLGTLSAAAAVGLPVLIKLGSVLGSVAASVAAGAVSIAGSAKGVVDAFALLGTAPGGIRGNSLSDVFTSLGTAARASVPLIGAVAGAIIGVGGIVYAFKAARDAYNAAQFDQMFGSFEEFAGTLNRNFSNFRQINASNTGTPDFLQGFVQQIESARDIVDQQKKNVEYLKSQAGEFGTAREELARAFIGDDNAPPIGSKPYDDYIQKQLGISDNSSGQDVEAALRKAAKAQTDRISAIVERVNPESAKLFREQIAKDMDDSFFKDLSQTTQRRAGRGNIQLVAAIQSTVSELFGGADFSTITSSINDRVKGINEEIEKANKTIGGEQARIAKFDFEPLLKNIQNSIFADVPKNLQNDFASRASGANDVNAAFVGYIRDLLTKSQNGEDIREQLKTITADYRDRLIEGGVFAADEISNAVSSAANRASALIFSETTSKMEELAGKAQKDLLKAQRQSAAASGDKSAEKALREMEELETLLNTLRNEADQLTEGFERAFDKKVGISDDMIGLLSGSTIADALDRGGEDRARVEDALQTFAKYQMYVKEEWAKLAQDAAWDEYLKAGNFVGPDINPEELFAASKKLIDVANSGKATAEEVNSAFSGLVDYFAENDKAAIAVIQAAGIPLETLNKAQIPEVAAGALMGQFGDKVIAALNTANIGPRVAKAFKESATFVDGVVGASKELIAGMSEAISFIAGAGIGEVGSDAAAAVAGTSEMVDKQLAQSEATYNRIRDRFKGMNERITTGNLKTDNRKSKGSGGRKGKSDQEQMAELEKFLADRNQAIIDAQLELMEFTGDFDINEYIQLNIKKEESRWETKIADVKEKYAKMFDEVRKGTDAIREYKSAMDDASGSKLGNPMGDGGGMDLTGGFLDRAAQVIKKFEGFRTNAYFDVNAQRVGFGSDTTTDAMGNVSRVTKDTQVTVEEALRDLQRRITTEFAPSVQRAIGPEVWAALGVDAQAALTSIAYNFGTVPDSVIQAAKSMSNETLATAIEGLKGLNDGVNDKRRQMEADIVRGSEQLTQTQKQQYGQLSELQNQEISLLERQKQAHLDYANSAEYSAKMALQGAEATLDAYIRMNEQTGSFFQGLAAGSQSYINNMQTNFQTGMETMSQLVNGFTQFGGNMFNDFFTKVATGEEKLGTVLRRNLSQMLLGWGKYFADLAMKYLADWVLRKTLGLFGGGGGMSSSFFPAAPSFGGGGGSGVGLYAKGGVFDNVTPFANGGVVDNRQYFQYGSESKVGMMAEAGKEAIIPLSRDSRGRLGVIAHGGDEGQKSESKMNGVFQYNSSMTFDMRGSDMDDRTAQGLYMRMDERAQEAARQVIVEERRQGGLLYQGG